MYITSVYSLKVSVVAKWQEPPAIGELAVYSVNFLTNFITQRMYYKATKGGRTVVF